MIRSVAVVFACCPLVIACTRPPQSRGQDDGVVAAEPLSVSSPAQLAPGANIDAGAGSPVVEAGHCQVAWLPKGMVKDLPGAQTQPLIEAVRAWAKPGSVRNLMIDSQRGIAYAKSEDDLGGEPPFPRHTEAQAGLACGLQSRWLADSIHAALVLHATPAYGGIRCQDNVCCFDGMEFMSGGILVARTVTPPGGEPQWVIDAYAEVAQAALGAQTIHANRAYVAGALRTYRARACAGEPPGFQ